MKQEKSEPTELLDTGEQRMEDVFLLFLAGSVVFGLLTTVVLLYEGY